MGSHPHDIVTFFVVFIKRDYGDIGRGWNVVDVGANIGMFSIYAALNGANRVLSFEPNTAAFEILRRNIALNGLEGVVTARNLAIGPLDGEKLRICKNSSPYNKVASPEAGIDSSDMELVDSLSLAGALEAYEIERVDLLKMDCEGHEYQIVPSLPVSVLDRISRIRMECHGSQQELMDQFARPVFQVIRSAGEDLWLEHVGIPHQ